MSAADGNRDPAAEIARQCRFFEETFRLGDTDGLVEGYFVDDALEPVACPPGRTAPVRGREALKTLFAEMTGHVTGIRLETVDLVIGHSQAFEIGRAFLTLATGDVSVERYAVCWLDTATGWRVKTDFFAADGWEN